MLPAYNPRAVFDIFRAEFAPIDYGQDHHMKPVEEVHDMKPHRHSGIMLSKTYSSMISGGVAGIGMSSLIAAIIVHHVSINALVIFCFVFMTVMNISHLRHVEHSQPNRNRPDRSAEDHHAGCCWQAHAWNSARLT